MLPVGGIGGPSAPVIPADGVTWTFSNGRWQAVDPSIGYVTIGTTQTVTGAKTFSNAAGVVVSAATGTTLTVNSTDVSSTPTTGAVISAGTIVSTNATAPFSAYLSAANNNSSGLNIYKRGATGDATAAVVAGAELGYNSFYGWDGSAYGRGAFVYSQATQNWTGSAHGARVDVYTTPDGSTTNALAIRINHNQGLEVSGTTDATSSTAGSVTLAGGLAVAKKAYIGTELYLPQATGTTLTVSSTDDATSTITGSVTTLGGGSHGVTKSWFGGGFKSTSPTLGIGYATGAGGTQTQITSKATTVVLNTICGTVVMHNANLAADTSVSFTFTNSAIAATDYVSFQHDSVGTLGAYLCCVTPGAGTATVTVHNTTPGALAEAIVLRFVVIKAVVS